MRSRSLDATWRRLLLLGAVAATMWVATAAAQEDPFAPVVRDAGRSVVVPSAENAAEATGACAQLSQSGCAKANTNFLLMAGGYVVLMLVITVVWTVIWSGRGATGRALKFAVPLLVGAAIAATAVGVDPFASEVYRCCSADPTFQAALLLGTSRVARAIVLGLLPFAALYVAAVFVVKALRR